MTCNKVRTTRSNNGALGHEKKNWLNVSKLSIRQQCWKDLGAILKSRVKQGVVMQIDQEVLLFLLDEPLLQPVHDVDKKGLVSRQVPRQSSQRQLVCEVSQY
jgi:hypothetical protein